MNAQPCRGLLPGLVIGVTLAAAPTVAMASVPPDRLGQAEINFVSFLDAHFPDAEVNPGPHCLLSEDLATATCEAVLNGENVVYIADYFPDFGDFGGWGTPEQIAAGEAATEAFTDWVDETFGDTSGDEPSCAASEDDLSSGRCHVVHDGEIIAVTFVVSAAGEYEWVRDVEPAAVNTALGGAVAACLDMEDESGDPYDQDDFELFDEGHSVFLDDSYHDSSRCVIGQLGWPDWISEQIDRTDSDLILWTTITFDGYTIAWQGDEVLIYDEDVRGT